MTKLIKMGSILIAGKAFVPDTLFFESERLSSGWILAKNLDRQKLERRIRDTGGALVSLRGDFKAAVCGFRTDKALRKAVQRLLHRTESVTYNCLEVTAVEANRVLGLLYITVSARAWRIVENAGLSSPKLSAV